MIEILVDELSSLPKEVVSNLRGLHKKDVASKAFSTELNKEEKELLELVKNFHKEKDRLFDDSPLITRALELRKKRKMLVDLLDDQIKTAQSIYEHVDEKVAYFDAKTRESKHLFTVDAHGSAQGKKKKKKNAAVSDEPGISMDPNEPVYCFCKRVSFGDMVGCENPDCIIEWFHFGCVGLTEEPKVWYCSDCIAKGFGGS